MPAMSQAELSRLLPHAGSMCLLHAIEAWDAQGMRCSAISHHDPSNPLRKAQQLPAICGLEYAAQAMALHCALTSGNTKPVVGYLGGVRDLRLLVRRLDAVRDPLRIEAVRIIGDTGAYLYRFQVTAGGKMLLDGRASVFLKYTEEGS
ncbi:MAG: hypothetical protein ACREU9_03130 [Gammaproteobacteria bacterium]